MMININIFYSPKNKNYYVWSYDKHKCNDCGNELYGLCHNINYFKYKVINTLLLCSNCYKENKKKHIYKVMEHKVIIINDIMPNDSIPVIIRMPEMRKGNLSVFDIDAIDKKYSNSPIKTIDNTKLYGRDNIKFKIGNDDIVKKIKARDKEKINILEWRGE